MAVIEEYTPSAGLLQPTQPEPEEAGFSDVVGLGARGLFKEAPLQAASTVVGMFQGREGAASAEGGRQDIFDKFVAEAEASNTDYQEEVMSRLGEGFGSEMLASLPNFGYSAVSLPVAAAGRLAGSALGTAVATPGVGTAAGFIGGALAAETAMSRSQEYREMTAYLNRYEQEKGSPLTPDEAAKVKEDMKASVIASGKYESIPEAIGAVAETVILGKLFRGGGKGFLKRGLRGAASTAAIELPTETITQIGQEQTREGTILDADPNADARSFTDPMDIAEAAREVAPGVLALGGGMGTAGVVGGSIVNRRVTNKYIEALGLTDEQKQSIPRQNIRDNALTIMRYNQGGQGTEGFQGLSVEETTQVLMGKPIKDIETARVAAGQDRQARHEERILQGKADEQVRQIARDEGIQIDIVDDVTGETTPKSIEALKIEIETNREAAEGGRFDAAQNRALQLGIPLEIEGAAVYQKHADGTLKLDAQKKPILEKAARKTVEQLETEIAAADQMAGMGRTLEAEQAAGRGFRDATARMDAQEVAGAGTVDQAGVDALGLGEPEVILDSEAVPADQMTPQEQQADTRGRAQLQPDSALGETLFEPEELPIELGAFEGATAPDVAPLDLTEMTGASNASILTSMADELRFVLANPDQLEMTPKERKNAAANLKEIEKQLAGLNAPGAAGLPAVSGPAGFRSIIGGPESSPIGERSPLILGRATAEVDALIANDPTLAPQRDNMIASRRVQLHELYSGGAAKDLAGRKAAAKRALAEIAEKLKSIPAGTQLGLDFQEQAPTPAAEQPDTGLFTPAPEAPTVTPAEDAEKAQRIERKRAAAATGKANKDAERNKGSEQYYEQDDAQEITTVLQDSIDKEKAKAEKKQGDYRDDALATEQQKIAAYNAATGTTSYSATTSALLAKRRANLLKQKIGSMIAERSRQKVVGQAGQNQTDLTDQTVAPVGAVEGKTIWGLVERQQPETQKDSTNIDNTEVYFDVEENFDGSFTVSPQGGTSAQLETHSQNFADIDEANEYKEEMNGRSFGPKVEAKAKGKEKAKKAKKAKAAEKPATEKPTEAGPSELDLMVQAAEKLGITIERKRTGKPKLGIQAIGKLVKDKALADGLVKNKATSPKNIAKLVNTQEGTTAAATPDTAGPPAGPVGPTVEQDMVISSIKQELKALGVPIQGVHKGLQEKGVEVGNLNADNVDAYIEAMTDALDRANIAVKAADTATVEEPLATAPPTEGFDVDSFATPGGTVVGVKNSRVQRGPKGTRIIINNGVAGSRATEISTSTRTVTMTDEQFHDFLRNDEVKNAGMNITVTTEGAVSMSAKSVDTALIDEAVQKVMGDETAGFFSIAEGAGTGTETVVPDATQRDAGIEANINASAQSKGYPEAELYVTEAVTEDVEEDLQTMANRIETENPGLKVKFVAITGSLAPDKQGQVPDGYNDGKGTLYVNVLSGQPQNFLLGHELSHSLEGTAGFAAFKKALDAAAKRAGHKVTAEQYHDFFGVAAANPQFWDQVASETHKKGLLKTVFDKVLGIIDSAILSFEPGAAVAKDYMRARRAAAQAYARYVDRPTPTPPKPEGGEVTGETATAEGFSITNPGSERQFKLKLEIDRIQTALRKQGEPDAPTEYEIEPEGDIERPSGYDGLGYEDLTARAAVDLYLSPGYGSEAVQLGSVARDIMYDVQSGWIDRAEASQGMLDALRVLTTNNYEMQEVVKQIAVDLRQQGYAVPDRLMTKEGVGALMEGLADTYDLAEIEGDALFEHNKEYLERGIPAVGDFSIADVPRLSSMLDERLEQGEEKQHTLQQLRQQRKAAIDKAVSSMERGLGQFHRVPDKREVLRGEMDTIHRLYDKKEADLGTIGDFSIADLSNLWEAGQKVVVDRANKIVTGSANPIEGGKNIGLDQVPRWMQVLSVPKIVEAFGPHIPLLKGWYSTLKDFTGLRDGSLNEFTTIIQPLVDNKEDASKFSEAAGYTTFYQVHPNKALLQQDWVLQAGSLKAAELLWDKSGMKATTGLTFERGYRQAVGAYNKLDEKGKTTFVKIAKQLSDNRLAEFKAYKQRVNDLTEGDVRAKQLAKANQMYKNIKGMYFPLSRFGDYFVIGTNRDTGQFELVARDTAADAKLVMDEMAREKGKDGLPLYEDLRPSSRNASEKLPQGVTDRFLQTTGLAIDEMITSRAEKEIKRMEKEGPLSDDERADILTRAKAEIKVMTDNISLMWLDSLPSTAAMKNSIRRKNTRGWDTDMVRSVSEYMMRHASHLASLTHGSKLEHDLYLMDKANRADNSAGKLTRDEFWLRGRVIDHLSKHLELTRDTPTMPVLYRGLSKIASLWYMTSPSAFLVQMSQLGVLTLPKLAADYGISKAVSIMGANMRSSFDKRFKFDNIVKNQMAKAQYEQMTAIADEVDVAEGRAKKMGDMLMSPAEVNAMVAGLNQHDRHALLLYAALRRNMISTAMTNEALEIASGRDKSRLMHNALWFMRTGEEVSRRAAVMSGFDLEYNKSKDWFKALDYAQHEANTKTMFDYSKEAKPYLLLKSPGLRLISQFQYYVYSLMAHVAHQSARAAVGKTPEIRWQARREMTYMMGTTAIMSGAMGMPLSAAAFNIIDMITHFFADDEEEELYNSRLEFAKMLRDGGANEMVARTVEEGVFGTMGAALSRRIGAADPLGAGENMTPAHLSGMAYANYMLGRYAGPSWSASRDIYLGVEKMFDGELLEGAVTASPKIMKDAFKAYKVQKDGGIVDNSGRRWSDETDNWDTVLMALGVNPYNFARISQKRGILAQWTTEISDQHRRMLRDLNTAIMNEDVDAKVEALDVIADWNAKFPQLRVQGDQAKRSITSAYKKELGIGSKTEQRYTQLYFGEDVDVLKSPLVRRK